MITKEFISTRNILIAVDVQKDFIDGSLAVEGGREVVQPINRVAEQVRKSLGQVAFTRDWHPTRTPHFDSWPVHCVAGTEGADFDSTLEVVIGDVVLDKGTGQTDGYSGAEAIGPNGGSLEDLIDPANRQERVRVFIGGLATDYCVKATAIDLAAQFNEDKHVELFALREAMRAVNANGPNDEIEALFAMRDAGVKIITIEDALTMIDENRLER
ncbi:MAG: isochorismatase family protein [Candidatus Saccharimonas sp.]